MAAKLSDPVIIEKARGYARSLFPVEFWFTEAHRNNPLSDEMRRRLDEDLVQKIYLRVWTNLFEGIVDGWLPWHAE